MRAALVLLAGTLFAAVLVAPANAEVAWSRCSKPQGFQCATVPVPLDHSGSEPGSIGLKVARSPGARPEGVMIALSGGPGQASVAAAGSFAQTLRPALKRFQLVVLDQRGTGDSGVLDCPALQPLPDTVNYTPQDTAACGDLVGPTRRYYRTIDSVDDLETLRQALGVDKPALMGVSYGTFVAEQYAARYPDHVDRLILDSVVPLTGVEDFTLSSFSAVSRVLTGLCGDGRCDGITGDPAGDTGELVNQLDAGAPISGPVVGAGGKRLATTLPNGMELFGTLVGGDLNPVQRSGYPSAVRSALQGDNAPILRLYRLGLGKALKAKELSAALNVTTLCEDTPLPFAVAEPVVPRAAPLGAAEAALDPNAVAPFDLSTVKGSSIGRSCLLWPVTPTQPVGDPGTLPDVPVLVLSGDQDLRTPNADAQAVAQRFPRASYVQVPGNGHDELGGDVTGCASEALSRFVANLPVRSPCSGLSNLIAPLPVAPTNLGQVPPIRGTGGVPGRSALAALATVDDVTATAVMRLFNGETSLSYGGLRGGFYQGSFSSRKGIVTTLRAVVYVPGIKVDGKLEQRKLDLPPSGTLKVSGGRRGSGTLKLAVNGTVSGTIGGKTVRVRAAAAAARARGGLSVDQLVARLAHRPRVVVSP